MIMEVKEYAEYLIGRFKDCCPTTDYDFQVKGAKNYDFNAIKASLVHVEIQLQDTIAEDPMFLCDVRDQLLELLKQ